ncbi:MAG: hypothetical protein ACPL7L_05985 [bacterium]
MHRRLIVPFVIFLAFILLACSMREENPAQSPSQVVEAFFKALDAKEYQVAYGFLTEEFQNQMPLEVFSSSIEQGLTEYGLVSQTYEILKEEVQCDLARVSYRVTSLDKKGQKLEGEGVYTLKKENGQWRIDLIPASP